ncbi:MAG: hypothetical protein WCK21_09250, partial [Actinomycetota bacterium]
MDRRLIRTWLLTVLAVTVPFWGVVVGRETAIYGDLVVYHLPTMSWIGDLLLHGHLPQWGQWAFAGQNVAGIGQGAMFYPFTLLFGMFGPVLGYRIWLLVHLWLGASGAFVWSWRQWHSRAGAAVSGIGYGLNGFIVLHLVHMNFTIGSAWLPWLLVGVDVVYQRWSTRRALALAAPVAMLAVSGHPQMVWLGLLTTGVYAVAVLARRDTTWRVVLRVAGAGAIGLGVAAISLVPQFQYSRTSVRSAHTMATAFELSARRAHLVTTVFPHVMGGGYGLPGVEEQWTIEAGAQPEQATHTGIVVVACAAFGLLATWRSRRTIALAVLAFYGITTAVAGGSPIARLAFRVVPMAGTFRAWGRNMVLFNLSASLLAGAGVVAILQAGPVRRRWLSLSAAAVTLLLVALTFITHLSDTLVPDKELVASLVVPLSCLAALIVAMFLVGRHPRRALTIILLATGFNMA